jgi:hypothetical protein
MNPVILLGRDPDDPRTEQPMGLPDADTSPPTVAELLERVRIVQAAFVDVSAERDRLATLVEILAADQPDGEEFEAGFAAFMARWPVYAGEKVFVERVVDTVLDAAWAVNHPERRERAAAAAVRRLSLAPGDVLTFTPEGLLNPADRVRLRDYLRGEFPGHDAVVLPRGELTVVTAADRTGHSTEGEA